MTDAEIKQLSKADIAWLVKVSSVLAERPALLDSDGIFTNSADEVIGYVLGEWEGQQPRTEGTTCPYCEQGNGPFEAHYTCELEAQVTTEDLL